MNQLGIAGVGVLQNGIGYRSSLGSHTFTSIGQDPEACLLKVPYSEEVSITDSTAYRSKFEQPPTIIVPRATAVSR